MLFHCIVILSPWCRVLEFTLSTVDETPVIGVKNNSFIDSTVTYFVERMLLVLFTVNNTCFSYKVCFSVVSFIITL